MYTAGDLSISFGDAPLLHKAQLSIDRNDRIALIGRNGEGKSTLMKIIAGQIAPDQGQFEKAPGLRIAYLPQEVPDSLEGTVFDIVLQGLGDIARLERAYHDTSVALERESGDPAPLLEELSRIQHELEANNGWELSRKVELVLHRLKIDPSLRFDALSGGMKRRAILGRELIREPDLLLLDEPTNHLDFDSIRWLEEFLPTLPGALLFVTHDRYFLKKIATSILELDRGRLTSFQCDYPTYLERKNALIEAEISQNAVFDKKLAQEEVWIRKGIKARRTRNEGRVRALEKLREERSQRRDLRENADFSIQKASSSGRKVITVDNLSFSWEEQTIVRNFSTTIWRGDKIGVIGPNGSGKTTLLRLLLGELKPQMGTVTHGTNLDVVYFDQHRAALDPELTLRQAVAGDEEFLTIDGQQRHVLTYLNDFLFTPEQARGKVSALSGGERNRLLLAKVFTHTANVLVMDEPTNDLDLETLELLEELLFDYPATLLLVSHDRQFLNRVVTQTFALEGNGVVRETVGGYDEYERDIQLAATKLTRPASKPQDTRKTSKPEKPRYRTNREQWELDAIQEKIGALETRQGDLIVTMGLPDFGTDPKQIRDTQDELQSIEEELNTLMERWEALESIPANPKKS